MSKTAVKSKPKVGTVEDAVVEQEHALVSAPTVQELTPMDMLTQAIDKGVDVVVLEKLLSLQERWETNQARKAFNNALALAKAEIRPIIKQQVVDFESSKGRTHYDYEGLSDIDEAVDPILSRHGMSTRYVTSQEGKSLTVTCILAHEDGHSTETTLTADRDESGNKNSIQAVGSVATYLQKYTKKLVLGLSAAKDDDANSAIDIERISGHQLQHLLDLADEVGCDKKKFCEMHEIESLPMLAAKNFEPAVKAMQEYGESNELI